MTGISLLQNAYFQNLNGQFSFIHNTNIILILTPIFQVVILCNILQNKICCNARSFSILSHANPTKFNLKSQAFLTQINEKYVH